MVQTSSRPFPPEFLQIPPLENGDRLLRDEFARRYAVMPSDCQAELIEGIVFMPAALRFRSHGKPHSYLNNWLTTYQIFTPGVEVADTPTIELDPENEPQPDVALFISPSCGGQTQISADDYIQGAPELIAEIAASTVSIDLGSKKTAYERNRVQEYIVWRVLDGAIDWFRLDHGQYTELLPDDDGITRSRQFPGLWLDRTALLNNNMPQVLTILQSGLATNEHQVFIDRLQQS
jgi:hypothetical protein